MQLDRTRIAIRERGLLETLDLALHVTREFGGPIAICALLAIVPLTLINYALVGRLAPTEFDETVLGMRYLWNITVLIYLEAPLASVFIVAYLGPAVFLEQRTIRQVIGDVFRHFPQLLLCHGLIRGLLLAWLLYAFADRDQIKPFIEVFSMILILMWSTSMRALRPFISEIILLEKNPLRALTPGAITINKRSAHLHSPYSGDLVIRWIGSAAVGILLFSLALATAIVLQGTLVTDWPFHFSAPDFAWNLDSFKLHVIYPACLWLVVVILAVAQFLSYLDLRIRHEGWGVELFMRAEALRLSTRVE
jgi:hypothetical protein